MKDSNYGIDYSGPGATCNRDAETGIRYGIIPVADVCQAWYDSSEPDYGPPTCGECGQALVKYDENKHSFGAAAFAEDGDYACECCELTVSSDNAYSDEAQGSTLDDGEYSAFEDSGGDVWVVKSPFYTHAQFCSPCAPGACHLRNPVDTDGPRCYCFGHEWFEKGIAPYPVYRVADGAEVKPKEVKPEEVNPDAPS